MGLSLELTGEAFSKMRAPPRLIRLALPALLLAAQAAAQAGPAPLPPISERLSAFKTDQFLLDRAALSARLDLSGPPDRPGASGPLLDLAALHLAHGLWTEARSLLKDLSPDVLSPAEREGLMRMRLLAALLDPTRPDPDLLPDPAQPVPDGWMDATLFRSLLGAGSDQDLAAAPDQIRAWPEPARLRALPLLAERAITQEAWGPLRRVGEQIRAHPDLSGSPADHFLQGVAAERGGLPDAALSAYDRASAGADLWAARARLAWADLALSSGLRPTEEVRDRLALARPLWRGGEVGLATLTRLFEVTRDLDRPLDALDLLSEIRTRHPEGADRVATDEDRWRLVETFYAQGESGEIPFGPFFESHLRLFRDLSTDPRYLDLAEGFAERLARAGALRLAGEEYRRALDTLTLQAGSARARVPAERLDRVRLRLAELLIDAGRPGEATLLLEEPVREAAFGDRQERLRARAHHALRDWSAVLTAWVPHPDPAHLRLLAQAHHALGDWADSRRLHLRLLEESGPSPEDLDRLITASFRAGRLTEDEPLVRAHLTGTRSALLDALLARDAPATRMRRAEIESRIAETGRVIAAAEIGVGTESSDSEGP